MERYVKIDDVMDLINTSNRGNCDYFIVDKIEELCVSDKAITEREIRNKAIDEAIETSAKAICVGCGYLDGYKCTYKGCNCGVSKPMLESVVKALEQMKGGAIDG